MVNEHLNYLKRVIKTNNKKGKTMIDTISATLFIAVFEEIFRRLNYN